VVKIEIALRKYLKDNVDDDIDIIPWKDNNSFPLFLRGIYNFYEMKILNTVCILLEISGDAPGVDVLLKHIKRVKEVTKLQVVLYYKDITWYRRKSLLKNRIPFVVKNGQMYLPFLGIDLKNTPEKEDKEVKYFSSSTQMAYLYFLYNMNEAINSTEFAKEMGWKLMTASRALNDLYDVNLITYQVGGKTGRSKEYKRIQNPEYFIKGYEYIKSPVKKKIYVRKSPGRVLSSGLEALAELSMLNPPGYPVKAISQEDFDKQKIEVVNNKDIIKDENLVELEIWDYDPWKFSDKKHVDIMSLYASFKGEKDERIGQALKEILRGEKWYTD